MQVGTNIPTTKAILSITCFVNCNVRNFYYLFFAKLKKKWTCTWNCFIQLFDVCTAGLKNLNDDKLEAISLSFFLSIINFLHPLFSNHCHCQSFFFFFLIKQCVKNLSKTFPSHHCLEVHQWITLWAEIMTFLPRLRDFLK